MPAQKKIRATTQDHLNIQDIKDDLVLLKNGACCLVIQTTAINFGLLSEKEQEATITAYAALLNSLTFPIQILIHSRQKDISSYLKLIKKQEAQQTNEKLKDQVRKYYQFVERTVQRNKILDKNFYIIIPYAPVSLKKIDARTLEKAKTDLFPKRDHLIGQFQRLGLKTTPLNNTQLIELFYEIYNPGVEGQKFSSPQDYAFLFVQPFPSPPPPVSPAVKPQQAPQLKPESQTMPKPTVQPSPALKTTPSPVLPPQQPLAPKQTPTPSPAAPAKPEPSLASPINSPTNTRDLKGRALQDHINSIVQQVAQQAPVKIQPRYPPGRPTRMPKDLREKQNEAQPTSTTTN